ncbi:hypothetical protein F2P81_002595 [Scophthalmus maximus]|uniref:Uncharacterized protein n=1 Tax=Scophthalmus maximus TaxID=52904 RepID=A0A6A4TET0_SCOMX|nr:hypothetical protein F2P81_002595 [Scophthalmus maximus]
MDVSLVARTFLQLFVNIRFAIIGIKALTSEMKEEKQDDQDVDDQQAKSRERFILISLRVLYTLVGIMSVFAGGRPSHCLVGFGVFVNVVGCIFAIAGIVLYAIDLGDTSVVWMCAWNQLNADHFGDNCRSSLLTGMDITLIVLAVLQLCVCISVAVLGVKSLANGKKEEIHPIYLKLAQKIYTHWEMLYKKFCDVSSDAVRLAIRRL